MKNEALNAAVTFVGASANLNFILWIADRLHLRVYGRTVTNCAYVGTEKGIEIDAKLPDLEESKGGEEPNLSATDMQCIIIARNFCNKFSVESLQVISTCFPEYRIGKMNISDFFKNPDKDVISIDLFNQTQEHLEISKEDFNRSVL